MARGAEAAEPRLHNMIKASSFRVMLQKGIPDITHQQTFDIYDLEDNHRTHLSHIRNTN